MPERTDHVRVRGDHSHRQDRHIHVVRVYRHELTCHCVLGVCDAALPWHIPEQAVLHTSLLRVWSRRGNFNSFRTSGHPSTEVFVHGTEITRSFL